MMHHTFIKFYIFVLALSMAPRSFTMDITPLISTFGIKLIEKSFKPCLEACNRLVNPESAKIFGGIVATTMTLDYVHNLIYASRCPEDFDSDEHDTLLEKLSKPLKETINIGIRPGICLGLSALICGRLFNTNPIKFSDITKPGFAFLSFLSLSSLGVLLTCQRQHEELTGGSEGPEVPKFARTSYRFSLYSASVMFPFVLHYLK
jgi:hypothetical protein